MNYFRCGGGRTTHTASQITVAKTPLASFESNVSGLYIPEILAYIQATQSGTGDPSPINPRAINGVSEVNTVCTGKNLANIFVDGKVPSISTGALVNAGGARTDFIKCFPSEQYTLSCSNSQPLYVFFYDENKGFLNYSPFTGTAFTVTTPLNAKYLMLRFGSNTVNNGMLEKGETATTFEPFGTTVTTALGGTYYGGYLNVTTGLMTVTRVGETIHFADKLNVTDLGECSRAAFGLQYAPKNSNTDQCDIAPYLYNYSSDTPHFYCIVAGGNNRLYFFYDNDATITDIQVVYELAMPQTIQLTPAQIEQLLGQNNVFCSTGDVAMKYWKID